MWYEDDSLDQWFSKCAPRTSSTNVTWKLGRITNAQVHPSLIESEILGVELAILVTLVH